MYENIVGRNSPNRFDVELPDDIWGSSNSDTNYTNLKINSWD
jgi:hypothetical protein